MTRHIVPEGLRRPSPKRGTNVVCEGCGNIRQYYARNRCKRCYLRDFETPQQRDKRLVQSNAWKRQRRKDRRLPYRKGGWNDPAVQVHHQRMVLKYFGLDGLATWGCLARR